MACIIKYLSKFFCGGVLFERTLWKILYETENDA